MLKLIEIILETVIEVVKESILKYITRILKNSKKALTIKEIQNSSIFFKNVSENELDFVINELRRRGIVKVVAGKSEKYYTLTEK